MKFVLALLASLFLTLPSPAQCPTCQNGVCPVPLKTRYAVSELPAATRDPWGPTPSQPGVVFTWRFMPGVGDTWVGDTGAGLDWAYRDGKWQWVNKPCKCGPSCPCPLGQCPCNKENK